MAIFSRLNKKILALIVAGALLVGAATATLLILTGSRVKKHLILNEDGNYGGTLSEELYGKGAPLNGEYDVKRSNYYTVNNDYYNMTSIEDQRIIIPEFSSYQQTMQDTSGIACLLMILNYMGEDVKNTYSELELVNKYEEINGTKIYGNGTTAKGLVSLVNELNLGYGAENRSLQISSTQTSAMRKATTKQFFNNNLKAGNFVLVRYQSPVGFSWKLVIGYDNLGTVKSTKTEEILDSFGDDVIIFAEPYDSADHFQDGYATERAQDFLEWWRKMSVNGIVENRFDYLVVNTRANIDYDYQPKDESTKQKLYDIHLPLNPDGTYGGTRNEALYGVISSGKGFWNHTDSNYYKINDFYNMGSSGSRIMLKNFTVLQQTMRSSCGICAVNAVLKYYGEEEDLYSMELTYLNDYEKYSGEKPVKGRGSTVEGHALTLKEWGYESKWSFTKGGTQSKFPTYESYVLFMRAHLSEGRPIVVSTYLGSGHFLTVIGYDDMGTDYIYDDVIITADSCDYWDGYQDGYNVFSAYKFYTQHTNSKTTRMQSNIVIYDKAN